MNVTAKFGSSGSPPFQNRRSGQGRSTELRLLVPSEACGAMIGKGGRNIKRLRETFNVGVTISDCDGPESILTVTAELRFAVRVLLDILPRTLASHDTGRAADVDARLLIHQSQAGSVIGRSGSKIATLREGTGTNIHVFRKCCPGSTERVVRIFGSVEAVVDAIRVVNEFCAELGINGVLQPYHPSNFDECGANEYGGFGDAGAARLYARAGAYGRTRMSAGGAGLGAAMGGRGGREGPGLLGAAPGLMGAAPGTLSRMVLQAQPSKVAGGARGMTDAQVPPDPDIAERPKMARTAAERTSDQVKFREPVTIPKDFAGPIIGPSGTRITAIRAQSGAAISIGEPGEGGASPEDSIMTITGTEEQVEDAHYLLQNAVLDHYDFPRDEIPQNTSGTKKSKKAQTGAKGKRKNKKRANLPRDQKLDIAAEEKGNENLVDLPIEATSEIATGKKKNEKGGVAPPDATGKRKKKKNDDEKKQRGGKTKGQSHGIQCRACPSRDTMRCVRCRVAYYCGRECQAKDWSDHKPECAATRASHKRLAVVSDDEAPKSILHCYDYYGLVMGDCRPRSAAVKAEYSFTTAGSSLFRTYDEIRRRKGDMIVKVQIPLKRESYPEFDPHGRMLAYNEDRSFQCYLDLSRFNAAEVIAIIIARGMYRVKGFFSAFMEEGERELILITDTFQNDLGW